MAGRIFIIFMVAVIFAAPAMASDGLVARLQAAVDTCAAQNPQAPGVIVHVLSPSRGLDTTLLAGRSDRGADAPPLTAGHTFRIASNTKTYVAAAVLRLVEEGKLGLDDPLSAHLSGPNRELLAGDAYDLDAMTIAQVLAHTSGLFEHPADPRYAEAIMANPQREWSADELVRLCVEWGDPVGAPGEKFQYSDTGYVLLGNIVKRLTSQPLGAAVHDLLDYEGLGLDATWWEREEAAPVTAGPRASQYYEDHDIRDWNPTLDLFGGGGQLSDADDLGIFMRALVEGDVLTPEMRTQLLNRGTPEYRLGVFQTELAGHVAWGHTGFWNTFAFHLPSLDLTLSGAVLSHHATRGQELADRLGRIVAAAD